MLDNANLAKLAAVASDITSDAEAMLNSYEEERVRQEAIAEEIVAEMRKQIYADFRSERNEFLTYVRGLKYDSPRDRAEEIRRFERAWEDELTSSLAALRPQPPRSQSAPKRRWTF